MHHEKNCRFPTEPSIDRFTVSNVLEIPIKSESKYFPLSSFSFYFSSMVIKLYCTRIFLKTRQKSKKLCIYEFFDLIVNLPPKNLAQVRKKGLLICFLYLKDRSFNILIFRSSANSIHSSEQLIISVSGCSKYQLIPSN